MAGKEDQPGTTQDDAQDDAQADADLEAGFEATEAAAPAKAAEEAPAAAPDKEPKAAEPPPAPAPKFVQITEEQLAGFNRAVEVVAGLDNRFSKVFGTIGDVQKIVKGLRETTPKGAKVELPKDAFKDLEEEFPDLAARVKKGVEAALQGITGTGAAGDEPDPERFQKLVTTEVMKLQVEALEDAHPDWRKIVGAIDMGKGEKPDEANPFRKWLGTKDAVYQAKINGTNSAAVIARAIDLFNKETAQAAPPAPKPAAPDPKKAARTSRIAAAVQPKGDGKPAPGGKTEEDDFEAGFKSG